ncbi:MAG: hypothetical protein WCS87_15325 [Methylococcaceae bacterium]
MKILKTLTLMSLLAAPVVSEASATDYGFMPPDFTQSFSSGPLFFSFSDTYTFRLFFPFDRQVAVDVTHSGFPIFDLSASLDGVALTFSGNPSFGTLFGVVPLTPPIPFFPHILTVSGFSFFPGNSYTGHITVSEVSAVPLPSGVWLFMSGLLGWAYTGKRKAM